jgi:hypothetical protein
MHNQSPQSGAADEPLHAASSSSSVDIRCAVVLAKVALQTLADINPEAASSIDHGLAHEIETARLKDDSDTLAVIAILSEVRARLAGEDAHAVREDSVWYID